MNKFNLNEHDAIIVISTNYYCRFYSLPFYTNDVKCNFEIKKISLYNDLALTLKSMLLL